MLFAIFLMERMRYYADKSKLKYSLSSKNILKHGRHRKQLLRIVGTVFVEGVWLLISRPYNFGEKKFSIAFSIHSFLYSSYSSCIQLSSSISYPISQSLSYIFFSCHVDRLSVFLNIFLFFHVFSVFLLSLLIFLKDS